MDRKEKNGTVNRQEPSKITRKIGSTTYDVQIHFSTTSKEGMTDKILRLIQNEDTTKICP